MLLPAAAALQATAACSASNCSGEKQRARPTHSSRCPVTLHTGCYGTSLPSTWMPHSSNLTEQEDRLGASAYGIICQTWLCTFRMAGT